MGCDRPFILLCGRKQIRPHNVSDLFFSCNEQNKLKSQPQHRIAKHIYGRVAVAFEKVRNLKYSLIKKLRSSLIITCNFVLKFRIPRSRWHNLLLLKVWELQCKISFHFSTFSYSPSRISMIARLRKYALNFMPSLNIRQNYRPLRRELFSFFSTRKLRNIIINCLYHFF